MLLKILSSVLRAAGPRAEAASGRAKNAKKKPTPLEKDRQEYRLWELAEEDREDGEEL